MLIFTLNRVMKDVERKFEYTREHQKKIRFLQHGEGLKRASHKGRLQSTSLERYFKK